MKTLILGLGNILLQDEGVGVRVIERLHADYVFPDHVLVLDGGTLGLDLLAYIEDYSHIVIVDAVKAGKETGTLIRLVNDEIPAFLGPKVSPHQVGLQDLLALAKMRVQAKQYSEAIPLLEHVVAIQPNNEGGHYNLMLAYRNSGRMDKAREEQQVLEKLQRPPEGEFTDFLKRLGEKTPGK